MGDVYIKSCGQLKKPELCGLETRGHKTTIFSHRKRKGVT